VQHVIGAGMENPNSRSIIRISKIVGGAPISR
jgi:hypothetical protein